MNALRWIGRQFFPLLLIVWLNGIVLRVTLRDSVDLLAPLYYITPWPVLAFLTLPIVWRFRRQPQMVFASIAITHVFLAMWIMEHWRTGQPSHEAADLRVVQWNVARPVHRFPSIASRLRGYDADLIAIAEVLPRNGRGRERWSETFAGYAAEFAGGNLLCLVRGEVTARESGSLGPGSYFARYDVRIKGRDLRVLQVDISGVPMQSRRAPLARLTQLADSLRDRPLIVLGDFNTPRDSAHFAELRKNFVNTFETAGIGSGETWPMPLPVLSLDQMWCGKGLTPVRCHHEITFRSDHRVLVSDLRFSE
ncbi:MAG: endonuclease/exonuclease/phosphatase family protein [Chthoniobacteraceae bacterium]